MKKTLLTLFAFFVLAGYGHAANKANVISRARLEVYPSFPSVDVYVTTRLAVQVTTEAIVISSYPTVMLPPIINAWGSLDAKIEIFNTRIATFHPNAESIFNITSVSTGGYAPEYFRIYCDSGVAVYLTGTVLPDITLPFRRR